MGKNKNTKEYVPEAFKLFGIYLENLRQQGAKKVLKSKINLEGLKKAMMTLSRGDRETIEKFWGLTGGANHSKKLTSFTAKDVAFIQMRDKACQALSKLNKLDAARMYDETVDMLVGIVGRKINMHGFADISELEAVKYLMAFLIVVENGPKMSFEQNLMQVETKVDKFCYLDEYEALNEMCQSLKEHPERSINFGLVKSTFDMMDVQDCVLIQKSFGLEVEEGFNSKEMDLLDTFAKIRAFKERIFEYGAWDVTCKLVLGYSVELGEFVKAVSKLHRNWSKMADFKTSQKSLRTFSETRNLDVYSFGELEFTDPYEVMFLYLEREFIVPKFVA